MSMILHCGSRTASYADVAKVPVPKHTDSWAPVPYTDAIGYLHEQADNILQMPVARAQYGLNKNGDQMFALLTLKGDNPNMGLSIGLRQSYNKSIALGVAVGAQVFVCDNLCFSGDAFEVVRKNTTKVWDDFKGLVTKQIESSLGHFIELNREVKKLKEKDCPRRRGYALLGVARGEGVLTATQSSIAFREWDEPSYEDFKPRTAWSLYNSITEALKQGSPGKRIDSQVKAHQFFRDAGVQAAFA